MHPKVLPEQGWEITRRLVELGLCAGWTLAGGTGLALQIGHRISVDLDFFRSETFDVPRMAQQLSAAGELVVQNMAPDTLHARVSGLRVSFLASEAPLLYDTSPYRGLALADLRDIAVMKVLAIGGRGSRKDFVDLYFCLRSGLTLAGILSDVDRRFTRVGFSDYHLLRSLTYFADAEAEPMPRMIRPVEWKEVRQTLADEVRRLV